jgi:hypothetical protein
MRVDETRGRGRVIRQAAHLPPPLGDPAGYDRLYREVNPIIRFTGLHAPWQEIRIPAGSTAEQVYRRLPSSLDHEYGGYLTGTRIRYRRCDKRQAAVPAWKDCTFHSRPTRIGNGEPDLPSPTDIRQFLLGRHRRTITVGRFLLWVWDKTEQTLPFARRLAAWEKDHLSRVAGRLIDEGHDDWENTYAVEALRPLGVRIPEDRRRWARVWPQTLRDELGFVVTVLEREGA